MEVNQVTASTISIVNAKGDIRVLEKICSEIFQKALILNNGDASKTARALKIGRSNLYRKIDVKVQRLDTEKYEGNADEPLHPLSYGFEVNQAEAGTVSIIDAEGNVRAFKEIRSEVLQKALVLKDGNVCWTAGALKIGRNTLYQRIDVKAVRPPIVQKPRKETPKPKPASEPKRKHTKRSLKSSQDDLEASNRRRIIFLLEKEGMHFRAAARALENHVSRSGKEDLKKYHHVLPERLRIAVRCAEDLYLT